MTQMRDELGQLKSLVGTAPTFDVEHIPLDPRALFIDWFRDAVDARVPEPHAMTLSTLGADGIPDARVLILKDVTEDGCWAFASGISSVKGSQLHANPVAALTFYWSSQIRSIRLRGHIEVASVDESVKDFRERGVGARAIALAGTQSDAIREPSSVIHLIEEARQRLKHDPEQTSAGWTVWRLRPISIEFWQGDATRNHLRIQYQRHGTEWTSRRLWP
ncbi:pyridoxal 5'-phosphate synthase [Leifsonia sp. YAF41]|uniref:pyridoxine/pyridoxamine 5'-phosphate oxidase n=1 Tax=Leifsonia sp. YAF41 TaxID=3233086 RepID=UPI003F9CEDD1